jgi:hypothetical protein
VGLRLLLLRPDSGAQDLPDLFGHRLSKGLVRGRLEVHTIQV